MRSLDARLARWLELVEARMRMLEKNISVLRAKAAEVFAAGARAQALELDEIADSNQAQHRGLEIALQLYESEVLGPC